MRDNFWQRFPLEELNKDEWEALCDRCARCCLIKLQDEDTEELYYTNVNCQYLCPNTGSCTEYEQRNVLVPTCVHVTPEIAREPWLPNTCAYRLLAEGKPLPDWHPLITGDANSVLEAGIAVTGRSVSELTVAEEDFEEHIVTWVGAGEEKWVVLADEGWENEP